MLRFFLNLSITPLPTEELNEPYAECLTEFVYYSLTSWRIKWSVCCVSYLIMSITCSPALPKKIYVEFHIKSVVLCLLSQRSVWSIVPNLWFVFCCKVGWSLLCNVFYVHNELFVSYRLHNLANFIKFNIEW